MVHEHTVSMDEARRIWDAISEAADDAGLLQGQVIPIRLDVEMRDGRTRTWTVDALRRMDEQARIMGLTSEQIDVLSGRED